MVTTLIPEYVNYHKGDQNMSAVLQGSLARMLESHPDLPDGFDTLRAADALGALIRCERVCRICADACLNEAMVETLTRCIIVDNACASWCALAADTLSSPSSFSASALVHALNNAIESMEECMSECSNHSLMHEHCAVCAETCRESIDICQVFLDSLTSN